MRFLENEPCEADLKCHSLRQSLMHAVTHSETAVRIEGNIITISSFSKMQTVFVFEYYGNNYRHVDYFPFLLNSISIPSSVA